MLATKAYHYTEMTQSAPISQPLPQPANKSQNERWSGSSVAPWLLMSSVEMVISWLTTSHCDLMASADRTDHLLRANRLAGKVSSPIFLWPGLSKCPRDSASVHRAHCGRASPLVTHASSCGWHSLHFWCRYIKSSGHECPRMIKMGSRRTCSLTFYRIEAFFYGMDWGRYGTLLYSYLLSNEWNSRIKSIPILSAWPF